MVRRVAIAIPVPVRRSFTYLWPQGTAAPEPGQRVLVPFGRRRLTGIVLGEAPVLEETPVRLRQVEEIVDTESLLPPALVELAHFVSDYYVAPIGEVFRFLMPAGMGPSREPVKGSPPTRAIAVVTSAGRQDGAMAILKRAPAQARALQNLMRQPDGIPVSSLAEAGVERRALSALAARSLIRIKQEPVAPAAVAMLPAPSAERRLQLTAEQAGALQPIKAAVSAGRDERFLVHGVTGAGKTEIYLRAAGAALEQGRGVLILVPEIGLTPALVGRLTARFGPQLAVLHSALTARERRAHWDRIRRGEALVVIGARSAVFAPLSSPGLIVVDEEQDNSYKQEETPRYNARDLALVRGRREACPVVLVSATPSMESYARAEAGRDRLLTLTKRVQERPLPEFEIVDLREEFKAVGKTALFSRRLLQALGENHQAGGQAMLLLNRRGWAAFLLCRSCGEPVQCSHCSVSMTYHRTQERLLCHYCGFTRPVPTSCPGCEAEAIQEIGAGTERVEDELERLLPGLRLLRMDADSVRQAGGHAHILSRFAAGEADLLLGTQMIAKGHDFPGVTLVGILGGDGILGFPDFRAAEWTFQLATQAAGRAGRGEEPGQVILQAFRAEHYALARAREHDFVGFYRQESEFRRALLYPPHAVLASVRVQHKDFQRGATLVHRLGESLRADPDAGEHLRILGPAPAPLARLRGKYRFHLLVKSRSRRRLTAVLHRLAATVERDRVPPSQVAIDVDPVSIL